ncbi:hypothetical protein KIN34_15195 [Cellulomonas sp. DKR-3]|uniref:Uncharacterized protein n=1 Tax=Cellulomonas fulva TaxID=2835530 RepID=A0ABS5U2J1_9CELL|nr:hypothetical protein [Cellulomonas fulva]MBT0995626.1 hypothetical protein [Cellulomonas fulva]
MLLLPRRTTVTTISRPGAAPTPPTQQESVMHAYELDLNRTHLVQRLTDRLADQAHDRAAEPREHAPSHPPDPRAAYARAS